MPDFGRRGSGDSPKKRRRAGNVEDDTRELGIGFSRYGKGEGGVAGPFRRLGGEGRWRGMVGGEQWRRRPWRLDVSSMAAVLCSIGVSYVFVGCG